ncbi:helix-turn-helix transcriptional regulator [Burkholderia cenocepacia]|uniref:helix-turn-helix domain-containing protein n=1 Tax=Burkholderia cenocepacia TaxID=95486 RepID=UPI001B8ED43F|nr:helix-turn-helix transcriptional regulator [Burkholderia cenocepacia]MBR7985494.1 helix-turn-helix transcriptional regulator [Burkholderia cenocepacia]
MSPLKKMRLAAGFTQAEVAETMGVSQPTYQRWESGNTPVPAAKVKKLARSLAVTVDEILGKRAPFDLFGIEDGVPDERTFFGEAAVHFRTKGILLPISEAARSSLHRQLFEYRNFLVVETLDNRMVFIRREAVEDIYFSSEAYDTYGPDHYDDHLGILPDDDFWTIVEHAQMPEFIEGELSSERISEVLDNFYLTDDALDELVKSGKVDECDRERVKADAAQKSQNFYERATTISWQLSSGKRRREYVGESDAIYAVLKAVEDGEDFESMIYLPLEGYHRTVFIASDTIDYIFVPKHKYREADLEAMDEALAE